jgi:hypothetical protein
MLVAEFAPEGRGVFEDVFEVDAIQRRASHEL